MATRAAKRKRASSPILPSLKRQRTLLTRGDEPDDVLSTRAKRRETVTTATPQRSDRSAPILLQNAPMKRQYGRIAQRIRERLAEIGSDSDSDISEQPGPVEKERGQKNAKKSILKITGSRSTSAVSSQAGPTSLSTTMPTKTRIKTGILRSSSGAVFEDSNDEDTQRTPVLELPKPPNTASIKRMLRNQQREMSENTSDIGDTDGATIELEETQLTPCPPRAAKAMAMGRRRQSGVGIVDRAGGTDEIVTPRPRRSSGKSVSKPVLDLGEFLDEQLRKASGSKPRKSLSSRAPHSDYEESEATPTKPKVAQRVVDKQNSREMNRVSLTTESSEGEAINETEPLPLCRPPPRPKKARGSYNAKIITPHKLDLTQVEVPSHDIRSACGTISRSTPPPETDIEGSGTEGNLTPASARVFNPSSSSPIPPNATFEEEEGAEKMALNDLSEDALPPQPVSPTKSRLPKEVPAHLARYFEAQKNAVLKTLRNPPFIDVPLVVFGERAPVEKSAYQQFLELLKATCERGEGNSCLLLGPRGSGKTLLIETAFKACTSNPIVIRLSGYSQTTDRLAMREIAYQLSRQTDTVFNIPEDELEGDNAEPKQPSNNEAIDITPPAAYLPTLISQLTTLKRPVIVVLDAFDLFAAHPRQALLYCLLDTVQSCRVGDGRNGLLVAGVSCVVNCINSLEKRVKSRFSHRVLKVPNPSTFDAYIGIAKELLGVVPELREPTKGKRSLTEWNGLWAESLETFITSKKARNALLEAYGLRRDIGNLARLLMPVVQALDYSNPWLSSSLLETSESSQLPAQYSFLGRLPQAAMWVLVALYHWGTGGHDNVNLKMVLNACARAASFQDGFRLVVSTGDSHRVSSSAMAPSILQAAFEDLVRLKVLQASSTSGGHLSSEYVKYRCMVNRETLRRVVEKHGSTAVKDWLVMPGIISTW